MFEAAGETPRPLELRAVNPPKPVSVRADGCGVPLRVRRPYGEWLTVARICERWRVDTNWWREDEIRRMYWELELKNGERLTVFRDLYAGGWYRHYYGPLG